MRQIGYQARAADQRGRAALGHSVPHRVEGQSRHRAHPALPVYTRAAIGGHAGRGRCIASRRRRAHLGAARVGGMCPERYLGITCELAVRALGMRTSTGLSASRPTAAGSPSVPSRAADLGNVSLGATSASEEAPTSAESCGSRAWGGGGVGEGRGGVCGQPARHAADSAADAEATLAGRLRMGMACGGHVGATCVGLHA